MLWYVARGLAGTVRLVVGRATHPLRAQRVALILGAFPHWQEDHR